MAWSEHSLAVPEGPAREAALRQALAVYVITDRGSQRGRGEVEIAEAALAGGATAIQLRGKELATRELCTLASALRSVCARHGALFVVNDRLDVALACGADGVHLGQDDLPVAAARRLAPALVLGVSAATPEEARAAAAAGADYLGVGSVFATGSKPDAGAAIGPEGLGRVVAATSLPVVAIGGITANNAVRALATGAVGVAVISAVVAAEDVEGAARALRRQVDAARSAGSGPG
jgi:thiamine-phosphate diphosphorylase